MTEVPAAEICRPDPPFDADERLYRSFSHKHVKPNEDGVGTISLDALSGHWPPGGLSFDRSRYREGGARGFLATRGTAETRAAHLLVAEAQSAEEPYTDGTGCSRSLMLWLEHDPKVRDGVVVNLAHTNVFAVDAEKRHALEQGEPPCPKWPRKNAASKNAARMLMVRLLHVCRYVREVQG